MNANQPSSGLQPRSARSKKNKTPAPPQMILVCFLALIIFGGLVYTLTLSPNGPEDVLQQTAGESADAGAVNEPSAASEGGEGEAADPAEEGADSAPAGGVDGVDGTVGDGAQEGAGLGGDDESPSMGTDMGTGVDDASEAGNAAVETPSSAADEPVASEGKTDIEPEPTTAKPVATAKPATTDYSKVALPYSYTVRKGDTLYRLSQLFYGSKSHVGDIASRNKLSKDAELTAGTIIVIPALSKSQDGDTSSSDKPASSGAAVVHTVKEGDTLYSISRTYFGSNSYAKKIAAYNQLGDGDDVKVGTKLKIPPKS
ncbi:LysM peptidoglycan-binding domain-containing protein [Paenibacillus xanthanilyticus]|uniref:LysM peptidoglycan-binding domain-containing protein n=1 Tax=Paenibacillus xanthanilyticus TaxID=1783531 RepID=A0ABV8KDN2_9BACL